MIIDRSNAQLVALDAADGARLATLKLAEVPNGIKYDEIRDRLYVLLAQSVIAVDPRTLQPAGRWDAPQPFATGAGMALDARGGRLYIAQPGGVLALALDSPEIAVARTYDLGQTPGALALAPNGATLYALNAEQARLWTINVADGSARSQALAASNPRSGYLSVSRDGRSVYVLLTGVGARGDRPALWRIDRTGQAETPTLLAPSPPPWDMELLDTGQLAIPRGDGRAGGVELIAADTLSDDRAARTGLRSASCRRRPERNTLWAELHARHDHAFRCQHARRGLAHTRGSRPGAVGWRVCAWRLALAVLDAVTSGKGRRDTG